MPGAKLSKFELFSGEKRFTSLKLVTRNATLMLLSEGEDSFGTLAVAVPQRAGMLGPPSSSTLLGDREPTLARFLAEHLAQLTGKMSLVSVFTKTVYGREAAQLCIKLFEETLKAEEEEV
ncbi:MAG: hypothetical protein QXL67_02580 [Candidatus Bathyarchaeia archaeon]